MRRRYLLTTIVLLSSGWVVAQSAGQPATYPNRTSPANQQYAAPHTETQHSAADTRDSLLEGCLGGSNGSFTLTDVVGKVYQLRGDTAKLAGFLGQQVSIIGTEEPGGASSRGDAQPTFTVKKVKLVGRVCSATK